ncbi:MAG: hypothetical protein RXO22_04650 [Thermocladium sp.]|jgi:hypothetical protein
MVDYAYLLLAIFAVSFAANATPFTGVSYTLIATTLLIRFDSSPSMIILAIIASGLGAAVSKNVMYGAGAAMERWLKRNRNINLLRRVSGTRYFYLTLVILAILPGFPLEDYVYFGSGAARTPLLKLNAYMIMAKLIKSAVEIPLELMGLTMISNYLSFLGLTPLDLGIISSAAFIVLGFIIFKIDWEKALRRIGVRI